MITTIDFPDSLPAFLNESYGIKYADNITRTPDDAGLGSQRQSFENQAGMVTVSLLLDDAQAQLFEGFYKYEAKSYNWFNAKIKTPFCGYDAEVCRFAGRYTGPVLVGCRWKYTFDLEIYKQAVFGREWYIIAPEYIEMSDIFDMAMNQEWPKP